MLPSVPRPPSPRRPRGRALLAAVVGSTATVLVTLLTLAEPAAAQTPIVDPTLTGVIDRLRLVIVGLLVSYATLRLTIGGFRYMQDEPEAVERGKKSIRMAAIGYGIAALAVPLASLLKFVVGA